VHVPSLSGRESAALFTGLAGGGTAALARADRLFDAFGLAEARDTPVSEYSFGMRRKLLLTETIAPAPLLLLLDEPSVGLDPEGTAALRHAVRESASTGCAVVMASNETRDLPFWGDRIVFLHRGAVLEDATVDGIVARLGSGTRIDVGVQGTADADLLATVRSLPGVESAALDDDRMTIRSSAGASVLPRLLAAALEGGLAVRDLRVREPQLADLFLDLTGERLPESRAGDSGEEGPEAPRSGPRREREGPATPSSRGPGEPR
jgi:ABC-2 type transport system ATP-binding protein